MFFENLKMLPRSLDNSAENPWTAWQSGCDPFVNFVAFVVPKKHPEFP